MPSDPVELEQTPDRSKGGSISLSELDRIWETEMKDRAMLEHPHNFPTLSELLLYEIVREAIIARQQRSLLIRTINERLVIPASK